MKSPSGLLARPYESMEVLFKSMKAGEIVYGLAAKYGSTQGQIKNWNKLANVNKIYTGQSLRVK